MPERHLIFATMNVTSPEYFSHWEKVGIVGILVAVILLHLFIGWKAFNAFKSLVLTVLQRFREMSEASDKHNEATTKIVGANTEASLELSRVVSNLVQSDNALHQRLDIQLQCPDKSCPVRDRLLATKPKPSEKVDQK